MNIGIISITEEFDLINTGNIRDLAKSIKEGLDRLYEQKMAQSAIYGPLKNSIAFIYLFLYGYDSKLLRIYIYNI